MIERNKKKKCAVHMIGTRWHFLIISRSTIGNELKFFFLLCFIKIRGKDPSGIFLLIGTFAHPFIAYTTMPSWRNASRFHNSRRY